MQGPKRIQKALTNFSIKYENSEFIFGDVVKDLNVVKDTDKYAVYVSEFRIPQTLRADGAPAGEETWAMSFNSYSIEKHSLKDIVTPDARDNSDAPLNLDKDTTAHLIDKIMLRQEYETHKLLFTTTTFSNNTTLTSNTSWEYHTTTSVPIQNALSATGAVLKASGKMINQAVMGWHVLEALKENQNVYNRFQYVRMAILTKDLLASVWDLNKVHVGSAIYDQGKEGATESTTSIWGTDCLFGYFKPKPGMRDVTTAVMIRNKRYGAPYVTKKWYDDDRDGDWIEVTTKCKPKAVATACAHLFKTVTL